MADLQSRKWEIEALLSNRRVELANSPDFSHWIEDSHALLSDTSLTHKKAFIRTFVKEIKVTGNDAVLTYTAPLPPQGLTDEKLRVLSSVQYGGAEGIRTPDLLRAKEALSQLSYSPVLH